jgi:hypothetical protein
VTRHSIPWVLGKDAEDPPIAEDEWELYGPDDWTQARNLAAEMPGKLQELQRLFMIEAARYNVFPIDDRRIELLDPVVAGRPVSTSGESQRLFPGGGRLKAHNVINVKNKSHTVTAQVVAPPEGGHGVLVSQGGKFGGWALYVLNGKLAYTYNIFGMERYTIHADTALTGGEHRVGVDFDYDVGGTVTLYVDGQSVGQGRVDRTQPLAFGASGDAATDLGDWGATPVGDDLAPDASRFTGLLRWVQIDLHTDANGADDDPTPEDRMNVVGAIQ